MNLVCLDGHFIPADQPVLNAQNRSFKWGDGIFETIKFCRNHILLQALHFERLTSGLQFLQMKLPVATEVIAAQISELCQKNQCADLARVRVAIYRKDADQAGYLIEAVALDKSINEWNTQGLALGLYPSAKKSTDPLSNIKSASFLLYVLAAECARQNKLDDAVVLNTNGHVCDTSQANIFLVKDHQIHTPSLDQGCINGVARRFLLDELGKKGYIVHQRPVSTGNLLAADEVFLTNSIKGMRWVASFEGRHYGSDFSEAIYREVFTTFYRGIC